MVFAYLGTPDDKIHEWYNGKYSSEYNEAYRYAYELNLIEEYIDYEDKIDQLTNNWRLLEEFIKDMLFTTPHENQMLDFILDKMKELNNKNGGDHNE